MQMALEAALLQHVKGPGEREENPVTLARRVLDAADTLAKVPMFKLHDSPAPTVLEELIS